MWLGKKHFRITENLAVLLFYAILSELREAINGTSQTKCIHWGEVKKCVPEFYRKWKTGKQSRIKKWRQEFTICLSKFSYWIEKLKNIKKNPKIFIKILQVTIGLSYNWLFWKWIKIIFSFLKFLCTSH